MSLIDQIDFINDDGVNRAMINDFMRNQFYDNIFAGNVQDQHCIDIGFGTGLLSILALKHGARSVTAYESSESRYELGKLVIARLGLEHQLQLIHSRFDHNMLAQHPEVTVVFSETVDSNLWQEGLFNSLPRKPGIKFLPGSYFLEIYACAVPDTFAQGLISPRLTTGFSPGIDIDTEFVNVINEIGFPGNTTVPVKFDVASKTFDPGNDTEWGWIPYMRLCLNNGNLVAGYSVDANSINISYIGGDTVPFDFFGEDIKLTINADQWKDTAVVVLPRVGMQHGKHRLTLDTGHWGSVAWPIVMTRPSGNITVTHSFYDGRITYTT